MHPACVTVGAAGALAQRLRIAGLFVTHFLATATTLQGRGQQLSQRFEPTRVARGPKEIASRQAPRAG